MQSVKINNWQLAVIENKTVIKDNFNPKTAAEVINSKYEKIKAQVPGNFELDLINAGKLQDLYYADNVLKAQELENRHLYYCTTFNYNNYDNFTGVLSFLGIDTAAEIYLDGNLLAFTENMFIEHEFELNISSGTHDLLVHIIPAQIYSRRFSLPANRAAQTFNYEQPKIRKAPYMYGWDIMPRILSGGLWKDVLIKYVPKTHIKNYYLYTQSIDTINNRALLTLCFDFFTTDDFLQDYTVKISGKCQNSSFLKTQQLFSSTEKISIEVLNPILWWPKNYGEPNLYNVCIELINNNKTVDKKEFSFGIRTVYLERTSIAGNDGKFQFYVNDVPVFLLGTNWVPVDAFPSRNNNYTLRALKMATELGCNVIRNWGGSIYPDDDFFDYCDKNGILIWQDFAMACARYPNDDRIKNLIKTEVTSVVKKLRNHACLLVWSGDNECDEGAIPQAVTFNNKRLCAYNPNNNQITREVILNILQNEDFTRPYIPSSPYFDEAAYLNWPQSASESHMWGPRDFFKGDFYANNKAHFISETGYHGCPSPNSLKKFLSNSAYSDENAFDDKNCYNAEWALHSSSPSATAKNYTYRIPLMYKQIKVLFKKVLLNREDFAKQSQISQAEAKKFFIEKIRINKGYTGGIIWWNLIDGWPQLSDAIVDWYGCKKLAFSYIKRSQQSFCIMCNEPKDNMLNLVAVNDTLKSVTVDYKVIGVNSKKIVAQGKCTVEPNGVKKLEGFLEEENEMYKIEWQGSKTGVNHYTATIRNTLNYNTYINQMKSIGFYNEFEGF